MVSFKRNADDLWGKMVSCLSIDLKEKPALFM